MAWFISETSVVSISTERGRKKKGGGGEDLSSQKLEVRLLLTPQPHLAKEKSDLELPLRV